jgi:hypothetical protein
VGSHTYDLYGSKSLSMAQMRDSVAEALGVGFRKRDSYFMGGTYFRAGRVGQTEFVVQRNQDEEGEPVEGTFTDYQVLLRIDTSDRPDELRTTLTGIPGIEFLRRDTA